MPLQYVHLELQGKRKQWEGMLGAILDAWQEWETLASFLHLDLSLLLPSSTHHHTRTLPLVALARPPLPPEPVHLEVGNA